MSLSETQTKIKIDHPFTYVGCSCSKLYNVFDEAFLADVSIYVNTCILMYVKRATSKVTLCLYEFYRQGYFSINISIFLILVE